MRIWALLSWYDESPAHLREMVESVAPLVDGLVALDGAYGLYPGGRGMSPPEQHEALRRTCDAEDLELLISWPEFPWKGGEVGKRAYMFKRALFLADPFVDWFLIMDGDMLLGPCDVPAAREELEATDLDVAEVEFAELAPGSTTHHISLTPFRSLFRAVPGLTVEGTHWLYVVPDDTRPSGRRFMWHGIVKGDDPREFEHAPEPAADLRDHVRLLHRSHIREPRRATARDGYYAQREIMAGERVPTYLPGESPPPTRREPRPQPIGGATMQVVYWGPHAAVEVVDREHTDAFGAVFHLPYARRGDEVTVPDEVGARLCEQADNWRAVGADKGEE